MYWQTLNRIFGVKSHIKSKKREDNRKVRKRFYWVLDYRDDDVRIPLEHTNFKIVSGFDKPTYIDEEGKTKEYPRNGIADHYNFVTHPKMPLNVVAARRYPCLCDPCFEKSIIPWDNEKEYADQDRWETAEDCEYSWEYSGLNFWKFLTLMPAKGFDEDEIFDCYSDALQVIEELMGKGVKAYKHGAVNADDPRRSPGRILPS